MFVDEPRQFTAERGVLAPGELGLDAVFKRGQPELRQPADLGLGERLEGEVGQRLTLPQGQCRPQQSRCRVRCAFEQTPRFPDQTFETDSIDLVWIYGEQVARLPGDQ